MKTTDTNRTHCRHSPLGPPCVQIVRRNEDQEREHAIREATVDPQKGRSES